jgi:glutathione S-transferase
MGAGPYLLGNAFTAADVNMGYSLVLAERFGLIEPGLSRVVSYFDGLKTRPHFLKALTL